LKRIEEQKAFAPSVVFSLLLSFWDNVNNPWKDGTENSTVEDADDASCATEKSGAPSMSLRSLERHGEVFSGEGIGARNRVVSSPVCTAATRRKNAAHSLPWACSCSLEP